MTYSDRKARALLPLLLAAAILLLAVSAGPGFPSAAASAAARPPADSAPFASAEEEWEEETGEWEVEDDEEEWEVGEEVEAGSESGSGWEVIGEGGHGETRSCMLHQASARVVASEHEDAVSLLVDYALDKPTTVKVEYWLKGTHGALQLKPLRRRMSRRGSLRGVERLSVREMSKVHAARAFVVDLEMAGTPSHCERYSTRHLTARQRRGDHMVWSEPTREARGR